MKQTTNLKLNKPDLTDSADITQLNWNWDEIDSEINKLKRCPDIASGTILEAVLRNVNNGVLNGEISCNSEAIIDAPTNGWQLVRFCKMGSNMIKVTSEPEWANNMFTRLIVSNSWYCDWEEVAKTDKIKIESYQNGWEISAWGNENKLSLSKSGNACNITGLLKAGTIDSNTIICSVPSGFRPPRSVHFKIFDYQTEKSATATIFTNGQIQIRGGTITQGTANVIFNVTYEI